MRQSMLEQNFHPLSEFRAELPSFLKQVHETKQPIVITQQGKGIAVLLEMSEYEAMHAKIELFEDIQNAELQLKKGLGVEHEAAKTEIMKRVIKS